MWPARKEENKKKTDRHMMDSINERGVHPREVYEEGGKKQKRGSDSHAARWRHNG